MPLAQMEAERDFVILRQLQGIKDPKDIAKTTGLSLERVNEILAELKEGKEA